MNTSTALALSHHHQKAQPSTSSASSAFQQQARKKVLNSVRSNQTRVIEHKPLSPRTKAAQQKREQQRRQNEAPRLQTSNRHGASNRNVYMHTNAMMGGLNTVSKNRFAKNTNGTVIGASRNGGIKPRQLTHAFSQQPLQTPLPPSKNGGIARGGDRFAVQSTPLASHFGGGIDGTPRRVPDTYNTIAVVESTPMQTSGGRGGGGGGGGTGGSRRTNNNESFTIEQTPLQSNRRPKFTSASGSGRRKRELEEVVAETPPTKNAAATRSGRLVQAALDNNTTSIKNKK